MSDEFVVARLRGNALRTTLVRVRKQAADVLDGEDLPEGARSKFAGREAILLLGAEDRSLRHFVLPPASAQNLQRMAVLQCEHRLPAVDGGYVFDVLARRADDMQCALVVAIGRRQIEARAKRLGDAGLVLSALAVEPLVYAALAPAKGRALLRLALPEGEFHLACRDGLPVGWKPGGPEGLTEEFLTKSPRAFEPGGAVDLASAAPGAAAHGHLDAIAAARYASYPHRLAFDSFVRREEEAPASAKQLLACAGAWVLALALGLAAAWVALVQLEKKRDDLKEAGEQRKQVVRISDEVVRDHGRFTALTHQLRRLSEGKPLATATLRRVSDVMPSGVRLTALSFSAQGMITLDCEASDAQTPILFLDLLRNTPGIGNPILEYCSDRGNDRVSFRISCGARQEQPAAQEKKTGAAGRARGEGERAEE